MVTFLAEMQGLEVAALPSTCCKAWGWALCRFESQHIPEHCVALFPMAHEAWGYQVSALLNGNCRC